MVGMEVLLSRQAGFQISNAITWHHEEMKIDTAGSIFQDLCVNFYTTELFFEIGGRRGDETESEDSGSESRREKIKRSCTFLCKWFTFACSIQAPSKYRF
jgi:hypothetical protein